MHLLEETRITLTDLAKREGVNVSTVWRWASKGCRGYVLESYTFGGKRCTTSEAFTRWVLAQNGGKLVGPTTAKQRAKAVEAADRELAEMGI